MRIMSLLLTVAMVRVWAPRLTLLSHASEGKQSFCSGLHRALLFCVRWEAEGQLLFLCLPVQEECVLITALNRQADKSSIALEPILFCTGKKIAACAPTGIGVGAAAGCDLLMWLSSVILFGQALHREASIV
jgi:hypothetical protein